MASLEYVWKTSSYKGVSMQKRCFTVAAASLLCVAASTAFADVWCTENIGDLKVYANGAVMFSTDKTCSFCQIGGSTDAVVNRGYALLLAAKTTGKAVVFYWPNISDCGTQNQAYAVPTLMNLND